MTSSINPANIDTAYPVAGQDNDTQGFRDNFQNIKDNFSTAKSEIEVLQADGLSLTGTNDLGFTGVITRALLRNNAGVFVDQGVLAGATVTVDYSAVAVHEFTTSASTTLAFSNWPAAGYAGEVKVIVDVANVAHTLTLPAEVTIGVGAVSGLAANVITFTATGKYIYTFMTVDGGSTVAVRDDTQVDDTLTNVALLAVDNITLDGNTIITTDADGDLTITPDETTPGSGGAIVLGGTTATIRTSATNQDLVIEPNGTATITVPAGYKDRAGFIGNPNSLATKEYVDAVATGGTIANIPLTADSGTAETINNGDTLVLAGGTNISTVSSASDTITFNLDADVAGLTSLAVDNLSLDGNSVSSTSGGLSLVSFSGVIDAQDTLQMASGIGITTAAGGLTITPVTGVITIDGSVPTIATTGTDDLTLTPVTGYVNITDAGSNTTTTTSGVAGGAATALPAQPVGYLSVKISGTIVKIPYYNVA